MTPTPHDSVVRAILGQPCYAAEQLRGTLPRRIAAALRLGTLRPIDRAFIDATLASSQADLLFRVELEDGEAENATMPRSAYVLIEHQSRVDPRMPWRLFDYQSRIWERHRADHPDRATVPPLIAVVLHHGARPWSTPRRFDAVYDISSRQRGALGRYLNDFRFIVDDLAACSDDDLRSRDCDPIVRLLLLALRNSRSHPRLHELLAAEFARHRTTLLAPSAAPALTRMVRYVLETDDAPPETIRAALEGALREGTRSHDMPTAADVLRAEALQEALLDQLEAKFGAVDPATRARIHAADKEQLREWMLRFVKATTVAAIFTG